MHEYVVALRIEHKEPLVEEDVNRLPPGGLDHELRACLAEDCCCVVDKLTRMCLDAQVDAALCIWS